MRIPRFFLAAALACALALGGCKGAGAAGDGGDAGGAAASGTEAAADSAAQGLDADVTVDTQKVAADSAK